MGKKRKLRKNLHKREIDDQPALVICVGKSCAPREVSRLLADQTRAYAAATGGKVRVALVGCLHICKKGPLAATWPDIEFYKKVDLARACRLIDELAATVPDLPLQAGPSGHSP